MLAVGLFSLLALLGGTHAQWDANCDGKQVIVHLFEWKWKDIALECERFLSEAGFCGFQVSPPMEHVILPADNQPWWQRYQPVSYKLYSRSGTEEEFIDMVKRCNAVGVRTYVDAVINHMTGTGRKGTSYAGSTYDADKLDFPGVPYGPNDFTPRSMCPSGDGNVNNYGDPNNVRNCYLVSLTDLYGATDYVRQKVGEYLTHLAQIGVAGIRIDAAKHMWPADIANMLSRVPDLPTEHGFKAGSRLFVYQEVIDRNDGAVKVGEYYDTGRVTEFRYPMRLAWGVKDYSQLGGLIDYGWGMAESDKALVFVDNHDTQRGGGNDVITYKTPREYKQATAYMLAHPYGFTKIMSSYYFDNSDAGPPHAGDFSTLDVTINADGSCGNGWVCEHRWKPNYKMVKFRNAVVGTDMANYWNNGAAVGFSRGNKGFFAMAKGGSMDQTLQTGLPAGTYCNIIDECQTTVTVNGDGTARIAINNYEEPILAICVGCDGSGPTAGPTTSTTSTQPYTGPTTAPPVGMQRTVIFVQKQTNPGQDLFIRGGIDAAERPSCVDNDLTSGCSIDITYNSLGTTTHYDKYNAWRVGDSKLDWYGPEASQGKYSSQQASGSPLAWTSNKSTSPGYQPLNTYGDHYWMIDVNMDCSETEKGWFELKAFLTNAGSGWEGDISQGSCTGTLGGNAPYKSKNHLGRCGALNVFTFGASTCIIDKLV